MAEQGKVGFGRPLRVPEFRSLWSAELISIAGDQIARVALSLMVFTQTSSAILTALTYGLTFVPSVLGGFLLSGLADRYPRRTVLVVTDVARAGLAALMAIPMLPLPMLWTCVGLLSVASGPFKAAHMSILSQVLDKETYPAGVALRQFTTQAAQLIGFAGGGALLVVVEPHVGMLLDAATFIFSAIVILAGVRARPSAKDASTSPANPLTDGQSHGGNLAFLYGLVCLLGLYMVPEGLAAPYAGQLGAAVFAVGLLLAADPAGSVVGAWLTTRIRVRTSPVAATLLAAGSGVALLVCGFGVGLPLSLLLWAASGALSTAYLIQTQTMVVEVVPDRRLGREMGRMATCMYCSQGISVVLGGLAAEAIGPERAVASAGLLATLLALAIGAAWKLTGSRRRLGSQSSSVTNSPHHSFPATTNTSSQQADCTDGSPGKAGATPTSAQPSKDASADSMRGKGHETDRGIRSVSNAPQGVTRRNLFALPASVVTFVLSVQVVTVGLTALVAIYRPASKDDLVKFGVLAGLGLLVAEATRYIERLRRQLSDTPHVNMSSVSILAVTVLTTPGLGAATTVVLYAHLWFRTWRRPSSVPVHRAVFNTCVMVLSAYAAAVVAQRFPANEVLDITSPERLIPSLLVIATFWAVNSALVGAVIALADRERSLGRLLGSWSDNALELVTLCIGILTAALMIWRPWMIALVVPMVYVLHRSVLVKHLEEAATTDRKTGLLNATSWHSLAKHAFTKAERYATSVAVLMVDLDNFKTVNDTRGHLVGDQVLRAVANALRHQVRGYDLTGRFGGEEFVVFLPETEVEDAVNVAERICAAVRDLRFDQSEASGSLLGLRLTVSIGVAGYPGVGRDLDDLLLAADNAMFAAKQAGRDRVCVVKRPPASHRLPQDAPG